MLLQDAKTSRSKAYVSLKVCSCISVADSCGGCCTYRVCSISQHEQYLSTYPERNSISVT